MKLHALVENELEAPALAWSNLAYYWGMSAFGLGPAYIDYMSSSSPEEDKAFNDESNAEINQIAGLPRRLTIKERFDRAVNFYAYCYEQGRKSAINPPYDAPPSVDDLVAARLRMESKAPPPDKLVQATNDALLGDRPDLQKMWTLGGEEKRRQRAQNYNDRVVDTLQYVASELKSHTDLSSDQLTETGFLVAGTTGAKFNVTVDLMDEAMPEEVQERKFGSCYMQPSPTGPPKMVLSGIFGAYYTMGHNLEMAMFDDESKRRLNSTYYAILRTWRQLDDLYRSFK